MCRALVDVSMMCRVLADVSGVGVGGCVGTLADVSGVALTRVIHLSGVRLYSPALPTALVPVLTPSSPPYRPTTAGKELAWVSG